MKKNIIIPCAGLLILAICTFYFVKEPKEKKTQFVQVPEILFSTKTYFKEELINHQNLDNFYIINFFASWCKPCLAEHPLLMELQSKGIKIIGVNFRDDENNFNEWIEEHGNPFEYVILDDGTIAYEMGLIGVPETYFIENLIIKKRVQGPLFYEDIEAYL